MDARLCALCECLSHLLSLSHDSILADEYSANLMVKFPTDFKPFEIGITSLSKRYEPVFTGLAVVKVLLRLVSDQQVPPPS